MTNQPPSPTLLIDAARAFNAGHYFEAHEILEDGLDDIPPDLWDLFVGLIQVSVGYHKVTQQLWSGARRMLRIGLEKLAAYPPVAGGLNLEPLRHRVRADVSLLDSDRFDRATFARHPPRVQPLHGSR